MHIIDRQAFTDLDQIFTEDGVFDLSLFQSGKAYHGHASIVDMMLQSDQYPVSHHATNIVVEASFDEQIREVNDVCQEVPVQSKGIGVGRNGQVGSVIYKDVLITHDGEWRIHFRDVQRLAEPGSQL